MNANQNTIAMAIYKFAGYGLDAEIYPVVNETEKSYMVLKNGIKSRVPKEEVGKTIHNISDYCPYVRVCLYNATDSDAKEALAKWFEEKAATIRK